MCDCRSCGRGQDNISETPHMLSSCRNCFQYNPTTEKPGRWIKGILLEAENVIYHSWMIPHTWQRRRRYRITAVICRNARPSDTFLCHQVRSKIFLLASICRASRTKQSRFSAQNTWLFSKQASWPSAWPWQTVASVSSVLVKFPSARDRIMKSSFYKWVKSRVFWHFLLWLVSARLIIKANTQFLYGLQKPLHTCRFCPKQEWLTRIRSLGKLWRG